MNRRKNVTEKTGRYAKVQEGIKARHPGYSAEQINVVIGDSEVMQDTGERTNDGSWSKEKQYVQF